MAQHILDRIGSDELDDLLISLSPDAKSKLFVDLLKYQLENISSKTQIGILEEARTRAQNAESETHRADETENSDDDPDEEIDLPDLPDLPDRDWRALLSL